MIVSEDNRYEAIYVRQSVYKEDSLSIDTQIKMAINFTGENPAIYADKGKSGKDMTHRKHFMQLIEHIKQNKIKKVVVYKIDRFSRSFLDFANIWEVLEKHKVQFISATELFDTSTPIGEALIHFMAIFAQLERKQLGLRIRDNILSRAELGHWIGSIPYGFESKKIQITESEVCKTMIANEKMEIMSEVFNRYAYTTISMSAIRKNLNDNDIPSPGGVEWTTTTISNILHNPVYAKMDIEVYRFFKHSGIDIVSEIDQFRGTNGGMIVGKKEGHPRLIVGNWPGYIESDAFLACQKRTARGKYRDYAGYSSRSWITGLMKCDTCGENVSVKGPVAKEKVYLYPYCKGRDKDKCRRRYHMRMYEVESQVEEQLKKRMEQCADEEIVENQPNLKAEQIKMTIAKVEAKISNLLLALANEEAANTTIHYINEEIKKFDDQKTNLYLELERISNINKPVRKLERICMDHLADEQKRNVAYTYIEKIILSDRAIKIIWKI